MSEHTPITTSPEAHAEPIRGGRRSQAEAVSANEHSGSLRYEHVHRIEITIRLLAGIAGRVRTE